MVYQIVDDLNVPKEIKSVTYLGPDPFRIYSRISPLLQTLFQARAVHVREEDFRWTNIKTFDIQNFYFRFVLERPMDKYTTGRVMIRAYGYQPKDPSAPTGRIHLEMLGTLRTVYPVGSDFISKAFFQPFLYIYHYLFYNQIRRRYLLMYRLRIERFLNEIRGILGIMPQPRLT